MSFKLIITGATGTAGSEALRQALLHPSISQVTVLTRRPLPPHVDPSPSNPKLTTILHDDFNEYPPALMKQLEGHDGVLWDLGISSVGFTEPAYTVITHDYALSAARAFSSIIPSSSSTSTPKKFVFAYLSGDGANQIPEKNWNMFGRVKGKAEKALAELGEEGLVAYSFRPAVILPIQPIPESDWKLRLTLKIVPYLRPLMPKFVIDTDTLAHGMINAVLHGGSGTLTSWPSKGPSGNSGVFTNEEIKQLSQ